MLFLIRFMLDLEYFCINVINFSVFFLEMNCLILLVFTVVAQAVLDFIPFRIHLDICVLTPTPRLFLLLFRVLGRLLRFLVCSKHLFLAILFFLIAYFGSCPLGLKVVWKAEIVFIRAFCNHSSTNSSFMCVHSSTAFFLSLILNFFLLI